MKAFITGAAGFIGSNFVNRELSNPDSKFTQIVAFDSLTYAGSWSKINPVKSDLKLEKIVGDIRNSNQLTESIKGSDIVIHFAAESHVDRSINSSRIFIETNVLGSHNVFEAARLNGVKTVIHVSTDEVYGSLKSTSATEDSKLLPNSPYAASKVSSDLLARAMFETFKQDIRVTRCVNNYGINQNSEKLIPKMIENLYFNKKIPIYGDGSNIRTWIHVNDHCEAILKVIENGKAGQIYNIGTEVELSNLNLAKKIIDLMDKSHDSIDFVTDRLGHDYRYSVSSSKIRNECGFKPTIDFELGLKDLISSSIANRFAN